ncbi:uracil-DNA glycosylase [Massilia sp. H6]|uniref:uracil-DNA glycosylase n=1 Tax=Massilia sp. H6 TaxID=2970464 RepID=UPI00216858E6|nr:uracil-DNA glycosylase [Massilia sp. H6]UVW30268.1 uracil-DNA glycosylase [Massilia sp. H6]
MSGRDAAFLAEMGIGPLWSVRAAPAAPADDAAASAVSAASAAPPAALAPPPMPRQVAEPVAQRAWSAPLQEPVPAPQQVDVSTLDWAGLRQAVASCRHCSACSEGRKPVLGSGSERARWLVAAGTASALDEQAGHALSGDAGKLLDNMLLAAGLTRATDAYVTSLVKCRPANRNGGDRAPTLDEVAACRPFLERERALCGAGIVLTLGQVAANGLLGKSLQAPLAESRGAVHRLGAVPLVATLHPGELLQRGADKALAWADLCRAKAADAGGSDGADGSAG